VEGAGIALIVLALLMLNVGGHSAPVKLKKLD